MSVMLDCNVVATVCDMGTNNIKDLKRLGSTRSEPFFQFQTQAFATIQGVTGRNGPDFAKHLYPKLNGFGDNGQ